MDVTPKQQALLQSIPAVDQLLLVLKQDEQFLSVPKCVLLSSCREVSNHLRQRILKGDDALPDEERLASFLLEKVRKTITRAVAPRLKRLVNATGIVIHTNLGRSLLCNDALDNVTTIAGHYSNLEYDLAAGKRGLRYTHIESILCEVTGAEAALVVNNNAGAVLLCLDTLASKKEVIVSRGELIEIGGSFRIPDIMQKSGAMLKEVGTTNRTHLKDYANAINENTALILKVHSSNFSVVGFVKDVPMHQVTALGRQHGVATLNDLGSGTLIDLSKYGLDKEPTVRESLREGADIVTFSGDKLLGGPQAGIILGKKHLIDKIKINPLTRALRIDKMTLAALESTLRLYRDETSAVQAIPTLRMLTRPCRIIEESALKLKAVLEDIRDPRLRVKLSGIASKAGGGSLPLLELPSWAIAIEITGMSANAIERHMRNYSTPIIGRIEKDLFIMDLRTILDDEFRYIKKALEALISKVNG